MVVVLRVEVGTLCSFTTSLRSTNEKPALPMYWSVSTKRYEVFPSQASYIRLIGTYLMEYAEDWEMKRSYIRPDKLQKVMEIYEARLNAA